MRKLSIEEKARRYDEAIERANNLHKDAVEMENNMTTKTCEIIFPELKESEDERIRKLLVEAVTQVLQDQYCSNRGVSKEKVITWLEKQGKNNMGISEATKKKLEDSLNKALEKETPESWNKFLEKQGEQNKQEKDIILCHLWHNEREKCLDKKAYILFHSTYDNTWNVFTAGTINWNVVDKWAYLSDIINIVNKDSKQSEQKPAWSEEDERMYRGLHNLIYSTPYCDSRKEFSDWFKSLKDRYTWKPSEEMLEALYRVIPENVMAISEDEMLLDKLYQGLKYGRVLSKN